MTRRDVILIIRALRESDNRMSVVTIDRVSNGSVTYGVKATGRDVRATATRAQEVYDSLAKKYNGGKHE